MNKKYITSQELYEAMLKRAKEDSAWDISKVSIEYINGPIGSDDKARELPSCEFDVIASTAFGTNEGIYADVSANGYIDGGDDFKKVHLCTLKTLDTDKGSYLALSNLANLMAYHAMQFISENMDRFD